MEAFPDIVSLIPHEGPSCLLDSVVEAGGDTTVCRASIPTDHPYLEAHGVHTLLAVELFAQAAAVHRALAVRGGSAHAGAEGPAAGRLAAAQATLLVPRLAVGSQLFVSVVPKGSFGDLLGFSGELRLAGEGAGEGASAEQTLLATGEISVAVGLPFAGAEESAP